MCRRCRPNTFYGSDNTNFALRGFVQDLGTAPSVGVFFADVISPRAASNSIASGDGAGPGSFFDLENVQILKGPQGTLFGRNTTGGDILLVPKKPTSELSGYIEGGGGNYNDAEGQAVINIPINDSFRIRAGVIHESRKGYLHSNSGVGPDNFDDIDYTAARLSAVIDILPNLENYTIASFSGTDDNGPVSKLVGADTTQNPVLSFPAQVQLTSQQGKGFYDVQQSLDDPVSRLQQWQVINTSTWKATDNLTVKNIASYAQLRDTFRNSVFGTNFQVPIPFVFADTVPPPGSLTAQERTMTEEFQLQGNAFDSRLTYQGGAYWEQELPQRFVGSLSSLYAGCPQGFSNALNCGGYAPFFGFANDTEARTRYRDYAFYFQDTYKIIDPLSVTTGVRWTNDRQEVQDVQRFYYLNPYPALGLLPIPPGLPPPLPASNPTCQNGNGTLPNCEALLVQKSQAPTWMIDFDYTQFKDLLLYAKYTRGYREGAINPTAPPGFINVQPEKVDTFELGEKFAFQGQVTGTVNASAFYNDFRNQQIQLGFAANPNVPGGSVFAAPQNVGKSRIWGTELDTTLELFKGARLDLGYTFLDTRLLQVAAPTLPPTSPYVIAPSFHTGDELVLSPRNKLSATPSYTLPLPSDIGSVTLAATWTFTGRQLTNYTDRTEPALAQYSYLDATKLLNLNANWNNIMGSPVDLSLFATNVTKEQYYTFCSGLGGTAPAGQGFETCQVGAPMMFGARVRYRYN